MGPIKVILYIVTIIVVFASCSKNNEPTPNSNSSSNTPISQQPSQYNGNNLTGVWLLDSMRLEKNMFDMTTGLTVPVFNTLITNRHDTITINAVNYPEDITSMTADGGILHISGGFSGNNGTALFDTSPVLITDSCTHVMPTQWSNDYLTTFGVDVANLRYYKMTNSATDHLVIKMFGIIDLSKEYYHRIK